MIEIELYHESFDFYNGSDIEAVLPMRLPKNTKIQKINSLRLKFDTLNQGEKFEKKLKKKLAYARLPCFREYLCQIKSLYAQFIVDHAKKLHFKPHDYITKSTFLTYQVKTEFGLEGFKMHKPTK